jgi:hypothetical protein
MKLCHYAECHCAECCDLFIGMLNRRYAECRTITVRRMTTDQMTIGRC